MNFLPNKIYFDNFLDDFIKIDKDFGIMKCDIYEKDGKYQIEMDIPGFEKNDISLDCENGYLTVEASKSQEKEEKDKKYIRRERTYGKIKRQFYVGNVDEDNVKAEFKDGVLKISVPIIDEKENKKRIEIE